MRFSDWPSRLNEFIHSRRSTPFQWGQHDCCLFAADAVQAITGDDHAAEYRGKYTTELGAARALKKHGNGTLEATLTAKLGDPIPRLRASRGDVVAVNTKDGVALGIFYGAGAICVTRDGLTTLPLNEILTVWRVE